METLLKRFRSKTYIVNTILLVGAFIEANTAALGITAPQAVAVVSLVNLVLRELTREPISDK